ncbi:hypothetical protein BZG36_00060 [Bifiguratus adelaidae]|uniref:G-protein coupled receptors family 3 profile domain-containing protein n=1 Tax=Bifiguratus adelaidae TaxID=1938954 RepID=A0A261Y8C7_9FUNG|nr:hypothetical protein BZG36_00060 [Bifiguratus adelaidae]
MLFCMILLLSITHAQQSPFQAPSPQLSSVYYNTSPLADSSNAYSLWQNYSSYLAQHPTNSPPFNFPNGISNISITHDNTSIIETTTNATIVVVPNQNTSGLTEIKVGILLPLSLTGSTVTTELVWSGISAIRLAVNQINKARMIPNAFITLIEKDSYPVSTVDSTGVAQAVYSAVSLLQQGVVGVIGDASSSWTTLSALLTSTLQIPQCSFSAGATSLSDKSQFPYFFRTIPTELMLADVILSFIANRGWKHFSVIYEDDTLGQQLSEHMVLQSPSMNLNVALQQPFFDNGHLADTVGPLQNLTENGARIIFVAASGNQLLTLLTRAAQMNLFTSNYVWLVINQITADLQATIQQLNNTTIAQYLNTTSNSGSSASPSSQQNGIPTSIPPALYNRSTTVSIQVGNRTEVVTLNSGIINYNTSFTGMFMFDNLLALDGFPPYETFIDEWAQLDPQDYPFAGMRSITTNEGLAYSCMMVMARGFRAAIANATDAAVALRRLASGQLGSKLLPQAFNTGYVGPEGPMTFDANGDVTSGNFVIYNVQNGDPITVGTSSNGTLNITGNILYGGGTTVIPADAPPSQAVNPGLTSAPGLVLVVITGLGVMVALGLIALVAAFRKVPTFKASSPLFCILELLGCIFTFVSVLWTILLPSASICYMRPIFLNFGFLLAIGNVVAKNFRVYRIYHNVLLNRTVITDKQLIKVSGVLIVLGMTFTLLYVLISPPRPYYTKIDAMNHFETCKADNPSSTLFVINTIYNGGLLLYAAYLAFRTRTAGSTYKECKQIAFSVYNIVLCAIIAFPISMLAISEYLAQFFVVTICILWATWFTMLALFSPKVYSLWKMRKGLVHFNQVGSAQGQMPLIVDSFTNGEILNLEQMLYRSQLPNQYGRKGSLGSVSISAEKTLHDGMEAITEAHGGTVPVQRRLRWFPFLSAWEMQHVIVFPQQEYFSCFSTESKRGSIYLYSQASVYSNQQDQYVLKVHGLGFRDYLIQVESLDALQRWKALFNRQRNENFSSICNDRPVSEVCSGYSTASYFPPGLKGVGKRSVHHRPPMPNMQDDPDAVSELVNVPLQADTSSLHPLANISSISQPDSAVAADSKHTSMNGSSYPLTSLEPNRRFDPVQRPAPNFPSQHPLSPTYDPFDSYMSSDYDSDISNLYSSRRNYEALRRGSLLSQGSMPDT